MKKLLGLLALLCAANASAIVIQGETSPGVYTNIAADALGNLATNNAGVAQNSTTASQTGTLTQGAVTTAAPSYTTGKTNPLSLTTSGALRIDGSAVTQPVSDVAVHPGDSTTYNRKLTQESYPYVQLAADTAMVTGPGVAAGVIVIATTTCSFIVYDSTAASGTKIFDSTGMVLSVGQFITFPKPIDFNIGWYVDITNTCTLNFLIKGQ